MSMCSMGFRVTKRKIPSYFGDLVSFSAVPLTSVGIEPLSDRAPERPTQRSNGPSNHHQPSSERMWTDAETLAGAWVHLCDRKEDSHLKCPSWV
jgi:hypothetical protein